MSYAATDPPVVTPRPNPKYDVATSALLGLHPEERIVLVAIRPDGPIACATFTQRKPIDIVKWLKKYGGEGCNLYHSVNAPDADVTSKPKKGQTPTAYYLHVDCDPQTGDIAAEKARYIALIQKYALPPSFIVDSGSGIHAYWKLSEPCPAAAAEPANKVLERHFTGGTQTFNVDRILRIPGTINYPNAKKITEGRAECLCDWVEQHPERKYDITSFATMLALPAVQPEADRSAPCFNYILRLMKEGKTDAEISVKLLDPGNLHGERIRERSDPAKYAQDEIARARKAASPEATTAYKMHKNAELDLVCNRYGNPVPNRPNLQTVLRNLEVKVARNLFTNQITCEGVKGFPDTVTYSDDVAHQLRFDIEDTYKIFYSKDAFNDYLSNISLEHKYHPVIKYLDGLTYDGVKRIDTWLSKYMGVADSPYTRAVGRIHLIAAVRRVKQPGCKYDTMLVFVGEIQGQGKSSACGTLAKKPEWFAESLSLDSDPKKLIESISRKWIIECAEMVGYSAAAVAAVKGLVSRATDTARLAYARLPVDVPRQSVFFGSTNNTRFLHDSTGSRRFWPVDVIGRVDNKVLSNDVDQLWAEAVIAERSGESIVLPESLWKCAAAIQEAHAENTAIYETLAPILSGREGRILNDNLMMRLGAPKVIDWSKTRQMEKNQAMSKLGWKPQSVRKNGKQEAGFVKGSATSRKWLTFVPAADGGWDLIEEKDSSE